MECEKEIYTPVGKRALKKTTESCTKSSENNKNEKKKETRNTFYLDKKIESIEKEIEEMEQKKKYLEEEMELHNTEVTYMQDLYLELEVLEKELENAYVKWEEIQIS